MTTARHLPYACISAIAAAWALARSPVERAFRAEACRMVWREGGAEQRLALAGALRAHQARVTFPVLPKALKARIRASVREVRS